jgi:Leucine-rich repeat (LRR) protein
MARYRDLITALQNAHSAQELDFPRKKLRNLNPEVGCLENIERLNLGYNKLKELPSTFRNLRKLKSLDLSNNLFKEIPNEVFDLSNLEVLDLRYNRIRYISPEISRLHNLKQLNLRANIVETMPRELAKLPQLKFINFYGCNTLDWEQVFEVLAQLKNLESLDLSLCKLKKLPENFKILTNLKSLNLSENPELDLSDAVEKISLLPQFEDLNITGVQKHLPYNLDKIKTLKQLTFDRFSENEPILSRISSLKVLDASHNRWHKIPQWVFHIKNLERLILKSNKIDHLPSQIEKLSNLKELDLSFNNLHHTSMPLLNLLLQLEKLDLDGNRHINRANVMRFKQALDQADLSIDLKKVLIQIFAGKIDLNRTDLSLEDLIRLLKFKIPFVSTYALALIEHKLKADRRIEEQIPSDSVLYLAGTSERYAIKTLQQSLKLRGIKLSKVFNEKVTHVVLSNCVEKIEEFVHAQVNFISDAYLQNQVIIPDMQTFSEDELHKLRSLLRSTDSKNNLIALQLMTHQGIPINLYAEVTTLAFFSAEIKVRQTALKNIFKYYPTDFQALIKWLDGTSNEKKIKHLIEHPLIQKIDFVNLVYEISGLAKEYIIQWGGTCFERVVKENINYSNILSLRFNISDISPEIEKLKYINKLEIIGNSHKKSAFTQLPEPIFRMTQLEYLRIDESQLKEISPSIVNLINLRKLRFTESDISEIPRVITQLNKLEILSIFNNKIQVIPDEIGELTELEEFWAFSNQIKVLPASIGKLKKLKHLHLSSNQLEVLPPEIGNLINLEELSLSGNPLKSIPSEIANLKKLKRLELSHSPILDNAQKSYLKTLLPHCNVQLYR